MWEWELRTTRGELSFGMQNRGVFTWLTASQFPEFGCKGWVIRKTWCHGRTLAVRSYAASDAPLRPWNAPSTIRAGRAKIRAHIDALTHRANALGAHEMERLFGHVSVSQRRPKSMEGLVASISW